MWLLHPEFKEKFRVWWQEYTVEGWEGHKFMRKLKFVKSKLKAVFLKALVGRALRRGEAQRKRVEALKIKRNT